MSPLQAHEIPFLTEEEQFSKDMAERLRSLSERVDRIALQRDLALAALHIEQERRMDLERELDLADARAQR